MFSDILKNLRKEKKVTQEELAKIIGVERSSVGKYESTNIMPSTDVLINMADYFNVTVDYLLGRTDQPQKKTPAGDQTDERKLGELLDKMDSDKLDEVAIKLFLKLSQDSQEDALKYLQYLESLDNSSDEK